MSVKPVTNDGLIEITFSKKMRYPDSWIKKHEEDKLILGKLEQEQKRRLEEGEEMKDGLRIKAHESSGNKTELESMWFLEILEPKRLKISLFFKKPEAISMSSQS